MNIKFGNICNAKESIILHQVNCCGVMGAGVAKAIRERFPNVYESYVKVCKHFEKTELLGKIQCIASLNNKTIVNCFAQLLYGHDRRHTNYEALKLCLQKVHDRYPDESIAIPFGIGCGLAGGDWKIVEPMIEEIFGDKAVLYRLS